LIQRLTDSLVSSRVPNRHQTRIDLNMPTTFLDLSPDVRRMIHDLMLVEMDKKCRGRVFISPKVRPSRYPREGKILWCQQYRDRLDDHGAHDCHFEPLGMTHHWEDCVIVDGYKFAVSSHESGPIGIFLSDVVSRNPPNIIYAKQADDLEREKNKKRLPVGRAWQGGEAVRGTISRLRHGPGLESLSRRHSDCAGLCRRTFSTCAGFGLPFISYGFRIRWTYCIPAILRLVTESSVHLKASRSTTRLVLRSSASSCLVM